ncbi:hypothetical protein ABZY06_34730 [Streptomyces sp. NPDC006540]|uniref:hypothetical protein n=1 Tax=Streptomyces sp. NPDC006540 TaxID=3155353 RepID=UPI0033B383E5
MSQSRKETQKLEREGINSWNSNSNSAPGQRCGTRGGGSRGALWSLAWNQR